MKYFASFCLSLAVVLGAALSSPVSTFGCGGSQTTGCKVAASPLTVEGVVRWLRTLELLIP